MVVLITSRILGTDCLAGRGLEQVVVPMSWWGIYAARFRFRVLEPWRRREIDKDRGRKKTQGLASQSPLFLLPCLHAGSLGDLTLLVRFPSLGRPFPYFSFYDWRVWKMDPLEKHTPPPVPRGRRLHSARWYVRYWASMIHHRSFPICQAKPSDVTQFDHDGLFSLLISS